MILIIRALLEHVQAANSALRDHGAALLAMAEGLESGAITPEAAAAELRLLAEDTARSLVHGLPEGIIAGRHPPIVDTGKP